jgi:hypothetical protein
MLLAERRFGVSMAACLARELSPARTIVTVEVGSLTITDLERFCRSGKADFSLNEIEKIGVVRLSRRYLTGADSYAKTLRNALHDRTGATRASMVSAFSNWEWAQGKPDDEAEFETPKWQ